MFSLLLLSLAIVGREPPSQEQPAVPKRTVPLPGTEAFYEAFVKNARNDIEFFESLIEQQERLLKMPEFFSSSEDIAHAQKKISEWRQELAKMKKFERELTRLDEQRRLNPNSEADLEFADKLAKLHKELWPVYPTAPMPREVKR